ncbi:MAG TPA: DUF4139 domain-containing protein [Dyella sp.]|uniref:DUF4139 domain-containing protein n=1 Tax=Dyella sp. TaxID=1869338 RepID=UPI002D79A2A1|nr:DUF4139 domain-containing protein [Dyella sp.]HET6553341.1 DUF4139 domain-containing protein [Dyella sp.]
MSPLPLRTLAFAIAASMTAAASAASTTSLTLYRSDDAALFSANDDGGVQAGYAVAREPRELQLKGGMQDISLGGLPRYLDPEAMALSVEGDAARVVSQRLLLAQGPNAALGSLVGQPVEVLASSGQTLASGTLLRAGEGLLVQDASGRTSLIREFASVRAQGTFQTGSSLQLRVEAKRAGNAQATLSYTTAGLGWRSAYVGTLAPGDGCSMQFEARASIANRSGRDWNGVKLTLIAGEPQIAKPTSPRGAPAPMMYAARAKADVALPEQSTLADYRSYTLPSPVDLPDGSVSQVPLYESRSLECKRTMLYEYGGAWTSPQPILQRDYGTNYGNTIASILQFRAFDSLPAGYLRVFTSDRSGTPQFIGEDRINDTPKGDEVRVVLGTAFDLRGERERTAFSVDKAGHTMDEAFRITLTNASDKARVVTVREHPSRWRQWKLVSSSGKPSQQTTDTLEFQVTVPAGGKATLDYAVRYQWTDEDHPQG